MQRRAFVRATGSLALALGVPLARAQAGRTAKLMVGFPAGGSADVVTRLYAEALRGRYAENTVVENRTGAGARLAVQGVKSAPPDGNTLLLSPTSVMTLYPHVYRRLGYEPLTDLTPIAPVARFAFGIAVRNDLPIRTLAELSAWGKANADKSTYGSPAAGASPHFLGQVLAEALGIKLSHVPYRGTGPAMQDLIGGQLACVVSTVGDLVANHRGGRLRMIGVSSEARLPTLPDIPTFKEQGFERATLSESFAIFGPPGLPAAQTAAISQALKASSATREMADSLAKLEAQPEHQEPAAFVQRLKRDTEWWGPIVKASGFQIDE